VRDVRDVRDLRPNSAAFPAKFFITTAIPKNSPENPKNHYAYFTRACIVDGMHEVVEARLTFALCWLAPGTELPSSTYILHWWRNETLWQVFDAAKFSKEDADALCSEAQENQSNESNAGQASPVPFRIVGVNEVEVHDAEGAFD